MNSTRFLLFVCLGLGFQTRASYIPCPAPDFFQLWPCSITQVSLVCGIILLNPFRAAVPPTWFGSHGSFLGSVLQLLPVMEPTQGICLFLLPCFEIADDPEVKFSKDWEHTFKARHCSVHTPFLTGSWRCLLQGKWARESNSETGYTLSMSHKNLAIEFKVKFGSLCCWSPWSWSPIKAFLIRDSSHGRQGQRTDGSHAVWDGPPCCLVPTWEAERTGYRQASAGLDGDLENITAPPTALPFPGHSACLLYTNYLSSSVLQQGINGVMNWDAGFIKVINC